MDGEGGGSDFKYQQAVLGFWCHTVALMKWRMQKQECRMGCRVVNSNYAGLRRPARFLCDPFRVEGYFSSMH